jgi:Tol biopolymer transport system component
MKKAVFIRNIPFQQWFSAVLLGTLLAGCSGAGNPAAAPVAALGGDQVVFDSDRSGNHEICVMNADGSHARQLTSDSAYENWWPRISPDRKTVLFYRAPAGKSENYAEASLWRMNADGSGLTELRPKGTDGWAMQGHAEWSPDGSRIAMFGSAGSALEIFVTDAGGKNAVQFTNRGGINTDVSWSPDGSHLLFNGCPTAPCAPADYEIYAMPATPLASATRLTNDSLADYDPYFSPDGSKIAWLTNVDPAKFPIGGASLGAWAIRIADADGSNAAYLINDGNINSKPAWSRDGQTIFFHRMELDPLVEAKFGVFRMNRDGTGRVRLTATGNGNNEYPSN